jgi:hypothetical protein
MISARAICNAPKWRLDCAQRLEDVDPRGDAISPRLSEEWLTKGQIASFNLIHACRFTSRAPRALD